MKENSVRKERRSSSSGRRRSRPASARRKKSSTSGRSRAAAARRRKVLLEIIMLLLAAGALFWGLFYVKAADIVVVGNSGKNYTDLEITEMSLPEFWTRNTVLLRIFRRKIDLKNVRFMENVEVEVRSRNSIRLHVKEKKPVGFVRLDDRDLYFDHDGIVLEIMSAEETALLKQQNGEGNGGDVQTEDVPADSQQEGDPAVAETVQEFNPDLADVPMITGLNVTAVAAGQRLPLSNPSFFNTIQFLTKMIDKYGIQPDYVQITEDARGSREMTLCYGAVRAALGSDTELEEKVTRLAAILPKLAGRSGVLHLEEFTGDTINIVFEEDS